MPVFPESARAGRPRSAQSHQAIIDATLTLLAEAGFDGMSIEAVAARAGVGKTTIYRRWDSKEALVIDALAELEEEMPVADTGNIRADLLAMVRGNSSQLQSNRAAPILLRVIGELAANPDFMRVYYSRVIASRLRHAEAVIVAAQRRGEIRPDVAPSLVLRLITGSVFFELLFGTADPNSAVSSDDLLDVLWQGIGTPNAA